MEKLKAFKDLVFKPRYNPNQFEVCDLEYRELMNRAKQAVMWFENGYGVRVMVGGTAGETGSAQKYLLQMMSGDNYPRYDMKLGNTVESHLTEEEVTQYMKIAQEMHFHMASMDIINLVESESKE